MPHIHPQIDFTVEVFIVFQGRVLLRKHDKYGIWLGVGGHVELDEDPNQAALREVWEEVGLDVTLADHQLAETEYTDEFRELIPPAFLNRHRISDTHEHVTMVYLARADTSECRQGDDEISDALHWFTRAELNASTEVLPRIRVYAARALEVLGGEW